MGHDLNTVCHFKVCVDDVSKALKISPESVKKIMKDGRHISKLTEEWSGKLYGLKVKDSHDGDGYIIHPNEQIECRTLTNNVCFQRSKNRGVGRTCTQQDVIDNVKSKSAYIVFKHNDMHSKHNQYIHFSAYPLSQQFLLGLDKQNLLTISGISSEKFVKYVVPQLDHLKNVNTYL